MARLLHPWLARHNVLAALIVATLHVVDAGSTTPNDVSALCDIYFSMGGDTWADADKVGWDSCTQSTAPRTATTDPCDDGWPNVGCSVNRVVSV